MRKPTKRRLFFSITALILCCAMLAGTTFAWFTSSASSERNIILSGNLGIKLVDNAGDEINSNTPLFELPEFWEPGAVSYAQLNIQNVGDLDLKYKMSINFEDVNHLNNHKLSEVLKFAVIDAAATEVLTLTDRAAVLAAAQASHSCGTLDDYLVEGNLYTTVKAAADPTKQSETGLLTLVVFWPETANDNWYNANNGKTTSNGLPLQVNLGVKVAATQLNSELDSFGPEYDRESVYPVLPDFLGTKATGNITVAGGGTLGNGSTSLSVPVNAVTQDTYAVFSMELTDSTVDSVTYEISLKDHNGNNVPLSSQATVTADIGPNLINVQVKHNGMAMDPADYSYDRGTGILTIRTSSFSPFQISYEFDGVASLNGVAYPTLWQAVEDAQNGDTVVVLKNTSDDGFLFWLEESKNITVDLNGKTLTNTGDANTPVVQVAYDGAKLKVKNGTINAGDALFAFTTYYSAVLTLDNVTINCKGTGIYGKSAQIALNNVDINSTSSSLYAVDIGDTDNHERAGIILNNCEVSTNYWAVFCCTNVEAVLNSCTIDTGGLMAVYCYDNVDLKLNDSQISSGASNGYGVYCQHNVSAVLDNTKIDTNGIESCGVFCKDNVTIGMDETTVHAGKWGVDCEVSVTSKLNNCTISSDDFGVFCKSTITANISNTIINAEGHGAVFVENVTAKLIDTKISANDLGVSSEEPNNNITLSNCDITSNHYGIYHNGSKAPCTITVTNSRVTDTASAGVYIANSIDTGAMQTLRITDSKITGPTAVEVKHTNATIEGCTLLATQDFTSREFDNGHCTAGYGLAVTSNGSNDTATGTVTVTDCKMYNSTKADYVEGGTPNGESFVFQTAEGASVTIDGVAVSQFNTYANPKPA